jgi:hypothetical protein
MARKAIYFYDYTATTCPGCGQDWTEEDGVGLVVSVGGRVSEYPTRLDSGGMLEDVDNLVANGYHSATRCAGCGELLVNLDVGEEMHTIARRPARRTA